MIMCKAFFQWSNTNLNNILRFGAISVNGV